MSAYILSGAPGLVIIGDATGAVSAFLGFPTSIELSSQTLTASLHTDSDSISDPQVGSIGSLTAPLVVSDDAFYGPTALVGSVSLLPALLADSDDFFAGSIGAPPQVLTAALYTDSDTFYAPRQTFILDPWGFIDEYAFVVERVYAPAIGQIVLPSRVTDSDTVHAPNVRNVFTQTLLPSSFSDTDTFLSLFVTLVGLPGGPLQKLKPPPKIQDNDVIFAFTSSRMSALVTDNDIIRAPVITALSNVLPGLVTDSDTVLAGADIGSSSRMSTALLVDDDAIYGSLISMILEPALKVDGDGILAADVGWQVIADFTDDVESIYSVDAYAFYPLYPEVWYDEETIDTYPFFVQQVQGGVPVPPREGVLTGSIRQPPQLTGSITKRRAA